ncbi:MAG: electron transfer flavoprotein alpha subunit [Clostridiales bacterium]|nr:electron transfer flavoprotein alpha subunit [Clostridiales bacterium]
MMRNIWIVATEQGEVASLINFLELKSADVTALVIGSQELAEQTARVGTAVKWIDSADQPATNFTAAAASIIQKAAPTVIIGGSSPEARAVIGSAAAALGAAVASNVISLSIEDDVICAERSVLDDKLIETLEMPIHTCLLVNALNLQLQAPSDELVAGSIETMEAKSDGSVEYLSVEPVAASGLQTADYVVGVGLGATGGDLFNQTVKLAEVMGAEMGCSMPIYSELQLMPHETYIGLTGCKVAPKLYLALGISGTSQHCAGLRNAKTIVCVNKDPKALFFNNADYGIVGDLNDIIPALIAALS